MTFYKSHQNRGYSLVEVLVAMSVLMIAVVGPMTIAAKGLKNASAAKQQITGFYLAQEGIETLFKIREDNALEEFVSGAPSVSPNPAVWSDILDLNDYSCTLETPCGVDIANDFQIFSCSDQTCDLFLADSGRTRYNHNSNGEATSYRREIVLDVNDTRIHVISKVSWGDTADKTVELETFIYNIYEN